MPRTDNIHLPHMPQHLARPVIHLNGTSREALYDAWEKAFAALSLALSPLTEPAPNMRDYYILRNGEAEFRLAQEQHFRRIESLQNIRKEFDSLMEETDNEGG